MLLFFIGLVSGIIGGMGIGGGTILIPSLIFIAGVSQHMAQGTNLTAFIPSAICALFIHIKNKHIKFKLSLYLILAGLTGAIVGSIIASYVTSAVLRRLFGTFLMIMGIYEFLRKEKDSSK